MPEFTAFGKIPRLRRDVVITEKIDGTNGAVGVIPFEDEHRLTGDEIATADGYVYAQSRNRVILPEKDNYGFAAWVHENADELALVLGPGLHFGEWWGKGINRGYGVDERYFSLFNTKRWDGVVTMHHYAPANLLVVPTLYKGMLYDETVEEQLDLLREHGSFAAKGFHNPEGIVMYHTAANSLFKVTLENDQSPKGK